MPDEETPEISLGDAAKQLGVTRATLYYYMRVLNIESKKYPLDKRAYMLIADFERIKKLKNQARERSERKRGDDAA